MIVVSIGNPNILINFQLILTNASVQMSDLLGVIPERKKSLYEINIFIEIPEHKGEKNNSHLNSSLHPT